MYRRVANLENIELEGTRDAYRGFVARMHTARDIFALGELDRELRQIIDSSDDMDLVGDCLMARSVLEEILEVPAARATSRLVRKNGTKAFGDMIEAVGAGGSAYFDACDMLTYEPMAKIVEEMEQEGETARVMAPKDDASAYYRAMDEAGTVQDLISAGRRADEDGGIEGVERRKLAQFYGECLYGLNTRAKSREKEGVAKQVASELLEFLLTSDIVFNSDEIVTDNNISDVATLVKKMTKRAVADAFNRKAADGGVQLEDLRGLGGACIQTSMRVDLTELDEKHPILAKGVRAYFAKYEDAIKKGKEQSDKGSRLYRTDDGVQVSESRYRALVEAGEVKNVNPRFLEREAKRKGGEQVTVNVAR